ncbi:phage protease, partial [Accumulibacter sp.]|uniref:phage protease n=1 Tax=Accumulibacter sp. TaxID=2053492 RepID=UPI0035B0966A
MPPNWPACLVPSAPSRPRRRPAQCAPGPCNRRYHHLPRADSGQPADTPAWQLDGENAARLVADIATRQSARYIDYEHATLHAKLQSTRAPRGA